MVRAARIMRHRRRQSAWCGISDHARRGARIDEAVRKNIAFRLCASLGRRNGGCAAWRYIGGVRAYQNLYRRRGGGGEV